MIFPRKKPTLSDSQLIDLLKWACKGKVVIVNADVGYLPAPADGCAKEYIVINSTLGGES